jgi:hypothetical protein
MREEKPGAVASAPLEEPTEAAVLHIVLMPDYGTEDHLVPYSGGEGNQDRIRGMISASWIRLRNAIHLPR